MKNMVYLSLITFCLAVSCTNTKVIADNEKLMRGDWAVTNVSVEGINQSDRKSVV